MKFQPSFAATGTDAMLQFFTRSVDVAYMGVVPFMLGLGNGLPLRCVGMSVDARETHAIVVGKHVGPSARKMRIAAVSGSSGHFMAKTWAADEGIRAAFVDIRPSEMAYALDSGFIDAVSIWEPVVGRCVEVGARVAARGTDIATFYPDLVVASELAVKTSPGELSALVGFHREVAIKLRSDNASQELGRTLLGMSRERWRDVADRAFDVEAWPDFLREPRAEFIPLALEVAQFLEATGLANFDGVEVEQLVLEAVRDVSGTLDPDTEEIRVGYSDDIMCLPLLVGELSGWRQSDVQFRRRTYRPIERMARLPRDLRVEVESVSALLSVQPTAGVLELGRMLESRARALAFDLGMEGNAKSIAAVWTQFEEHGLLDSAVATSAHYVRSLRNVAAHEGDIRSDMSASALDRAIDVLEWLSAPRVLPDRCGTCRAELQDGWIACPRCGSARNASCKGCCADVESEWAACPYCGERLR